MSIYVSSNRRSLSHEACYNAKINNQFIISGETDPTILVKKGVLFLELLQVSGGGTVTITDGKDKAVGTGVKDFEQDYCPLRCDYGIKITGTVQFAKGYVVEGILE